MTSERKKYLEYLIAGLGNRLAKIITVYQTMRKVLSAV